MDILAVGSFAGWLAQQDDDTCVGESSRAGYCPIATYLGDVQEGVYDVSVDSATAGWHTTAPGWRSYERKLRPTLRHFVDVIDVLPYGHRVRAEDARAALRIATLHDPVKRRIAAQRLADRAVEAPDGETSLDDGV